MFARLFLCALLCQAAASEAAPGKRGPLADEAVSSPPEQENSPAPPAGNGLQSSCDAGAARFAIGKRITPGLVKAIKRASGAQYVRVLPQGAGATREFLAGRINIHLDKSSRVFGLRCG
jgi:hypothetical protein